MNGWFTDVSNGGDSVRRVWQFTVCFAASAFCVRVFFLCLFYFIHYSLLLSHFSCYLFLFHVTVFSLCDGFTLYFFYIISSSVVFCHVFCFWYVFLCVFSCLDVFIWFFLHAFYLHCFFVCSFPFLPPPNFCESTIWEGELRHILNWQWAEICYWPCFGAKIKSCLSHVISPTHPYFASMVLSVQSGLGNSHRHRRSIGTSWSTQCTYEIEGRFLRKTF